MKLNHLIYTLMLGTALGTSSCSWLDLEPATAVSPSILGQGEVEQLLTGTYRSLQNDPGRDTWVLFDMRGENLINTYLSGSNDFVNNEIPSNNGTLLTMWRVTTRPFTMPIPPFPSFPIWSPVKRTPI